MRNYTMSLRDQAVEASIEICERCGKNPASEPHPCPFQSDVYDNDTECTCCDECTHECAMDI